MEIKFSEQLKRLRLIRNLTQEDLAILCNIDIKTPSLLETGKRKPNIRLVEKISIGLRIHPSIFFLDLEKDIDLINNILQRYSYPLLAYDIR